MRDEMMRMRMMRITSNQDNDYDDNNKTTINRKRGRGTRMWDEETTRMWDEDEDNER